VVCLDPADGREIWAVDLQQRFAALPLQWGFSECLLADGPRLYVSPGGPRCLMAALDVRTGATVWEGEPLRFQRTQRFGGAAVDPPEADTDKAGYASPILVVRDGRRLLFGASARHLICVDAEDGALLWRQPVPARYEVIGAIPVQWRDCIFFAVPDTYGGKLFRLHVQADGVRMEELWDIPVDNCHGGLVVQNDWLFGSGYRRYRGWAAVDLVTGQIRHTLKDLANGSILAADGRLYALSERGVMALLEPGPEGFARRGSFRVVPAGPKDVWAHPVIGNGRLYLRCHEELFCYDIRVRP
jgi:outer membrane protein assembly factor BamB